MLKPTAVFSLAMLFLATWTSPAQTETAPGSIRLLPGYRHERLSGIDSRVGKIWKQGGVEIQYDIGKMAGNYADCKSCGWTRGELWRRKQIVNGQEAILFFTRAKTLFVVFPDSQANFYATINKAQDMADMLLMLLTFQKTAPRLSPIDAPQAPQIRRPTFT